MRVDLLTREYPPEIYGGAGVHVAELVRALRDDLDVRVRCFGAPRDEPGTRAYATPADFTGANAALSTMGVDLLMAQDAEGADLVHSHTWYANFAGFTAKRLHGMPHVLTAHSLEPLRPWKAEQLGGGYRVSSWVERTAFEDADAVVAVSEGMRRDILRSYPALDPSRVEVVHNGIDLESWRPSSDADLVRSLGVDPDLPSIVFVGRITRQKGLPFLLRAARSLPDGVQLVLCAGAPDTPEIMAEVSGLVAELAGTRRGVVWIDRHLPRVELTALLTAATCFVCPSVYEPLGIVNLEAMACGAAVVGTETGGIPEVVEDGVTGVLVPIEQRDDGTGTPLDPDRFVADLADALARVVADPDRARAMGAAGRIRAEQHFAWGAIAQRTRDLYARVLSEA
ncbi:glycogen synthase [Agromyces marinus]|uniref:glycogen synthase n=1 Tax=Agromyces marinus TaxID=1389020 RepID=UPI001F1DD0DB|nr:glycogen synthase [Agromyces marinus]UIP58627.1 Alpha-maltose-1-phosphate synthase [Agromyces marinus]